MNSSPSTERSLYAEGLRELKGKDFAARLLRKDPSLWKEDKKRQDLISRCLGWIDLPEVMGPSLGTFRSFAAELRAEGFTRALVLGMGGSSLACEVSSRMFPAVPGHPALEILDSTHPSAVEAMAARLDLSKTLFIVSSKSGSTTEPNCLMEHFFEKIGKIARDPGRQFAAITDPGTSLERLARRRKFRKVFLGQPEVGGRFSALSPFGLLPAALMGIDAAALVDRARKVLGQLREDPESSPALRLGAALGQQARAGRDKLTLRLPSPWQPFGPWIEQLVAESTGKEGRGILPVCGEPLEAPQAYGSDRFFVRLRVKNLSDPDEAAWKALEDSGAPCLSLEVSDALDLGGQFLNWEIATAAAGALLGVDPFDQPDVQSAKDQTKKLLSCLERGELPREKASFQAGGLSCVADPGLESRFKGKAIGLAEALGAQLARIKPGDYVAWLAYLEPHGSNQRALASLQEATRRLTRAPVTALFGPRYLHSTGQLYKGGPSTGVFFLLTDRPSRLSPIPGQEFDFSTLVLAQARGDFAAMVNAGLRILRLEMGSAGSEPLRALANALGELARS
ncbi:MAG: transaldolase [Elusimicrobia bacterium]|nr:transaldolase [Elusimicrobiota bacterium]